MKIFNMESFCNKINNFVKSKCIILSSDCNLTRFEYKIETIYGPLKLSFYSDKSLIFTLFTKFDHPEKAKTYLNCNPHSGKWNFHECGLKNKKEQEKIENLFVDHIIKSISKIL